MFTKGLEKLKNKQTEMNNTLEGINSRITEAKEQISDLEDRMVEITATKQNVDKRMKRNEDSLRDLWDHTYCLNNCLKCKWIKDPNQKTQTGWVDTETRPIDMLSTRDPPQTYRLNVRGWERVFHIQ